MMKMETREMEREMEIVVGGNVAARLACPSVGDGILGWAKETSNLSYRWKLLSNKTYICLILSHVVYGVTGFSWVGKGEARE